MSVVVALAGRWGSLQQREQAAFLVDQLLELIELRAFERQLRELLRGLAEVDPQARIVLDQLRIIEYQILANQSLERRRLLVELPAGAARLRRLQHGLLTLRAKAIEADDQLHQRVEQRQADQQEAEQNEL